MRYRSVLWLCDLTFMQPPDFGPGRASDLDPDLDFALRSHNFYWGALVIYSIYTRSNFGKIIGIFCRQGSIIEKIYFWLDRKFEAWVIREFEVEFESTCSTFFKKVLQSTVFWKDGCNLPSRILYVNTFCSRSRCTAEDEGRGTGGGGG